MEHVINSSERIVTFYRKKVEIFNCDGCRTASHEAPGILFKTFVDQFTYYFEYRDKVEIYKFCSCCCDYIIRQRRKRGKFVYVKVPKIYDNIDKIIENT